MQTSETTRPMPIAGILALVAGALLVVGSFLDWAKVSGTGTSVTASGTEGSDGWITLAAGVVALVAGLILLRGPSRRVGAILAIVAGLVGAGVGLFDALTATDSVLDGAAEELAKGYGGSVAQMRALLDVAIDAGELSVTIAVGLYMVIAGGVVAVVSGVIGLRGGSAAMPAVSGAPGELSQPGMSETGASAPPSPPAAPGESPAPALPTTGTTPPPPPAEPSPPPPPTQGAPDVSSASTPETEPRQAPEDEPPSPWAVPPDEGGEARPGQEP